MNINGRGAADNPLNRFERLEYQPDPEEEGKVEQILLHDRSKSILARNQSPDVGFDVSVNPYRGCEHGCIYCYARPTHEYLGFSAGLDFESRILVKKDAPALLRDELSAPGWEPQPVALSGVTDAYQPAERRLRLTRGCLEVFLDFRNPVMIVTKSHLVTRDLDLLKELNSFKAIQVSISVTSLDSRLQRELEPRAASPQRRLAAIKSLSQAGIPARVMVAPVIPGLTDHEIPAILKAAARAGARSAACIMLRLPYGVKDLFLKWLAQKKPERRRKVLNRLKEIRHGDLYRPDFHERMKGTGVYAEQVHQLFHSTVRRLGLNRGLPALSVDHFRVPGRGRQSNLF